MPKEGILRDYDLRANDEPSAQNKTCDLCGEFPMKFQWSFYSGEAMCTKCGCAYQLKWGPKEMQEEGNYPYLRLTDEFLKIAREYWNEKGVFVCYGEMLGPRPGLDELVIWLRIHHPEMLEEPSA